MTVFKLSNDADRKQERLRVRSRNDKKTRLQNLSVIPHLMRNLKKRSCLEERRGRLRVKSRNDADRKTREIAGQGEQ